MFAAVLQQLGLTVQYCSLGPRAPFELSSHSVVARHDQILSLSRRNSHCHVSRGIRPCRLNNAGRSPRGSQARFDRRLDKGAAGANAFRPNRETV
jgi:hypothetical protein